jgi:hypothetical protein
MFICLFGAGYIPACTAEPALKSSERYSILSVVGFNAAGFTGMTWTGMIFSAGSAKL